MHDQVYYNIFNAAVCSELSSPTNGQVFWTGLTNGSTATYTCDSGYLLIGDETRTCLSSGVWSGQEPTCESMKNIHWNVKRMVKFQMDLDYDLITS